MRGLALRLRTAGILLPPVLAAIYFGPHFLAIALCVVAVLGARELALLGGDGQSAAPWWPIAGAAVVGVAAHAGYLRLEPLAAVAAIVLLGGLIALARAGGKLRRDLPLTLFGGVYLGFLPAHLLDFYRFGKPGGADPLPVFFVLALVWGCDTGAYLLGNLAGRHRLWPRVSPKKSWEGAIGGLAVCAGLAILLGPWLPGRSALTRVIGGLIVGAAAQIGDLIESQMKRESAAKDSGTLFPGHGGVLDRIDSLVLAIPALDYWLQWTSGHTGGLQ